MKRSWIRRASVVALALVACLAVGVVAAPALPSGKTLTGHVERAGTVKLRIHFKNGHHEHLRVYDWSLRGIPVRCGSRWRTDRLKVTGGMVWWNRYADQFPFGEKDVDGGAGERRYVTSVRGRLLPRRRPFRLGATL